MCAVAENSCMFPGEGEHQPTARQTISGQISGRGIGHPISSFFYSKLILKEIVGSKEGVFLD